LPSIRSRSRFALAGALLLTSAVPPAAALCDRGLVTTCERSTCATPAAPVPGSLWNELRAGDVGQLPPERDTTNFNEFETNYWARNWFMGVDVENGWVIAGLAHGIGIWDARTNPAVPTFLSARRYGPGQAGGFPYIPTGEGSKIPFGAVDAPAGVDTLAAVAGYNGTGILVFDLRDKTTPRAIYQNSGKTSEAVYAARIAGRNYAFLGSQTPPGVYVYDLDRALTNSPSGSGCRQDDSTSPSACPGVRIGTFPALPGGGYYVHGVGSLVAVGHGAGRGLSLYDVSDPASPEMRGQALQGTSGYPVYGVAMWQAAGKTYAGARVGVKVLPGGQLSPEEVQIFDVTACATGPCSPIFVGNHPAATGGQSQYLTVSSDGSGKPFLYVGSDANCAGNSGATISAREYLLDVSNPAAPVNVTPTVTTGVEALYGTTTVSKAVNYWSWYYRESPSGFNLVAPRSGKFNGDYFYRAGRSVFDFHHKAKTPLFTSPPNATVQVGMTAAVHVTAIGIPLPVLSLDSGTLPPGMTFVAGVLAGIPLPGSGGVHNLRFRAASGVLPDATQNFTLAVREGPQFTSPASVAFVGGVDNSFTFTASGYPASTFTHLGGEFPPGVFFTAAGILRGVPAPNAAPSTPLQFRADNGVGDAVTQDFTLQILQAPSFTSGATTFFALDAPGHFGVGAVGIPAPTISLVSGALPSGVSWNAGVLSGTPAPGTTGTYPLVFKAVNGVAPDATQNFALIVGTGGFHTVTPCRLFDSRVGGDGPILAAGESRLVTAAGRCGIPATAKALSVNFTSIVGGSVGALQAYAGDQLAPVATVLSIAPNTTRANNGIVQLALNGKGTLILRPNVVGSGGVHVVVDVNGYFE
jgi:hypothetical protein